MSQWMITRSGQDYHLDGPLCLMPDNAPRFRDIAHALAQINRYTGHTHRPYSVAEHSLLVADIAAARGAGPVCQMAALMHDAHEAYCGDVSSPVKWALGVAWTGFEAVHALNVRRHFGLLTAFAAYRAEIKLCDLIALATERRDLSSFDPGNNTPWPVLDTPGAEVQPWPRNEEGNAPSIARGHIEKHWTYWRDAYLVRHADLRAAINQEAR